MLKLFSRLLVITLLAGSCNGGSNAEPGETALDIKQPDIEDSETQSGGEETEEPEEINYTRHFNKVTAWTHLVDQVKLGHRVPGTKPHLACRNYIVNHLEQHADDVRVQEFTEFLGGSDTDLFNIVGVFNPNAERRIMLAAHWDTRPTADKNPPGKRSQPILGANDGASGVAILMELARVFDEFPPTVGVDLVFFDAEDYGPSLDNMFLGSKHYARNMPLSELRSYNYGILIDMVGDGNLDIHPETHSEAIAGNIYLVAQHVNGELGFRNFKSTGGYRIYDDHLPFIERGMRMYNFIDFNYDYWHTTQDTVDKCHMDSLESVGLTLENLMYYFTEIYDGPAG